MNLIYAQKLDNNGNYYSTFPNGEVKYFDKDTSKIIITILARYD